MIQTNFKNSADVVSTIKSLLPQEINSVLSLGAGLLDLEKAVLNFESIKKVVAVEWSNDELNKLKEIDNVIALKYDLTKFSGIFPKKSFDIVTMFDIIEHLKKDDSIKLMNEAEKLAKKSVLAFIPVQKKFHHELDILEKMQEEFTQENNVLRCHLSLWTPEEMETLNYEVFYDSTYHQRQKRDNIEGAMICKKNVENL
jgi:2-polyprenyl-3-methyl-5-hydroxy-6-metoxy-1,4-benzoquinol methylase